MTLPFDQLMNQISLFSLKSPDGPLMFPGCCPSLTQCMLGDDPSHCTPEQDKWFRKGWMDGRVSYVHQITWCYG